MLDIVFPEDNEFDFIKMAEYLGVSKLLFVYGDPDKFFTKTVNSSVKIFNALFSDPSKVQKARHFSNSVLCRGEENNTDIIERAKPDILFAIEEAQKRDYLHHRVSGVNQVLCRLAVKNNVVFGFSFSSLLNKTPFIRSQIMGRMMQNISLFRKFKNSFCVASFARHPCQMRSPKDLESLFALFGMHPKEIQKAFSIIFDNFINNK